jgi:cytochrome c oxidase subunit IV
MSDADNKHFSPERIFLFLFALTALEVGWGYAGYGFDWGKVMLWGGLLFFAAYKAWLIAVYFMHLKFEGWVVWTLLLPTPFLVLVIMGYVGSDVGDDQHHIHPIGAMHDPAKGEINSDMSIWQRPGDDEGGAEH